MKIRSCLFFSLWLVLLVTGNVRTQPLRTTVRVLVLAETGDRHQPFVDAAKKWLELFSAQHEFSFDFIDNPKVITPEYLSSYRIILQLNYPPYMWTDEAKEAFKAYITEGRGGWVGFHHATLLGEFDGYPMWPWFSDFMGGIRYKNYIPGFVSATLNVEDREHPCMKGLPASFFIEKEEFYTYDKSPRSNVHVLASVNENTYSPSSLITMGDHPVVWVNDHVKARNVYIFMGHDPILFSNSNYIRLFSNALMWAGGE